MKKQKVDLGNGLQAEGDGNGIALTDHDGTVILLDPEQMAKLRDFAEQVS